MPGLLKSVPVTDEQRRVNDRHSPAVVLAVVLVLGLYIYLFTHIHEALHLPAPQDLAEQLGVCVDFVRDSDRNVISIEPISLVERRNTGDKLHLVFYLVLIPAFLCSYFLPLRYKQPSLLIWTLIAILLMYGSRGLAGILLAHAIVYLVLHPRREPYPVLSVVPGIFGYFAFAPGPPSGAWGWMQVAAIPLISGIVYVYCLRRLLLNPRFAPVLRTLVIQSAILTVFAGALVEGGTGNEWELPLGFFMFFWQWLRLVMYHIDYKDGLIPGNITFGQYLSVFFSPGAVPFWHWGVEIGQGRSYTQNSFLCENKNTIVISGLRILLVAMGYLVLANWIRYFMVDIFTHFGVAVHQASIRTMVAHFIKGGAVSTPSVLLTCFLDLIRWTLLWGGVVHFKVGVWRICGYRIDPYFDRPWLSTNLVTLWTRFFFHYREFLVRAFYFPVFFCCFKRHPNVRIIVATMAAAGFGNMVWGHLVEEMYYEGMLFANFGHVLKTWPYYILLGGGIAASQLYLRRRKRKRKPWTRGPRIIGDVIAAYCTLQFYAIIHIFLRFTEESTIWDHFRLFLIGFGIHL